MAGTKEKAARRRPVCHAPWPVFRDRQPVNWVVVDIENDRLAEHWDVIQDEATRESSKSGRPMFGNKFPA
jgi:hypothetical protein